MRYGLIECEKYKLFHIRSILSEKHAFSLRIDRVFKKIFPFVKGERSTFFFAKKKKVPKKKLATLQVDGLVRMGAVYCKARSLFANAHLKVHSLLGERNFAVHGSLSS